MIVEYLEDHLYTNPYACAAYTGVPNRMIIQGAHAGICNAGIQRTGINTKNFPNKTVTRRVARRSIIYYPRNPMIQSKINWLGRLTTSDTRVKPTVPRLNHFVWGVSPAGTEASIPIKSTTENGENIL